MNAEQQALVERWSGFCAKIDARLDELISESQAGVDALSAQNAADLTPLTNAMSGLDFRISQLRDKIEETWDGQVEDKFSDADNDDGFLDVGLDAKRDYEIAFDEKWTLWKTKAMAGFYRNMWPLVDAARRKQVSCTTCGGAIDPQGAVTSVSINCPHCSAVVQVIPEAVVQTYFGSGGHVFGEELAEPIRFQIERFREEVDRWRRSRDWAPEPIESMERWEQWELHYWQTYAQAQGQFLGKPPDEELIASRMKYFRQYNLENDQRWRKAKGLL